MLIKRGRLESAYAQIRRDRGLVIIFVSLDVDSICAFKILTELLNTDSIQWQALPVSSFGELRRKSDALETKQYENVRSVLLLNCGGAIDVKDFFGLDEEKTSIYILDSHRPYHLANVREGNTQVRVLDDDSEELDGGGYPSDVSSGSDSESSDDDESDSQGERASPKRRKIERRIIISEYYRGTSFATSASVLMYELASGVNKDTNELLWLSLIGLTDQYLNERIDHVKYNEEVQKKANDVSNKNDAARAGQDEDSPVALNDDGHIRFAEDYNFMVMRHWNLFDSMQHSRYVATRLGLWKEKGRNKLKRLLAKMSVPLESAKKSYSNMHARDKRTLGKEIDTKAARFGLENVTFGSFFRQYETQRLELSASDVVYALSAKLENPREGGSNGESKASGEGVWEENFWDACGALDRANPEQLMDGIRLCIEIQTNVVKRGCALIEGNRIKRGHGFRYAVMQAAPNDYYFTNQITLSKLGMFVSDALQQIKKRDMPFLVCAEVPQRATMLLCGIYGRERISQRVQKNDFGTAFSNAARQAKARVKHDGFERAVIEVEKDSLQRFLEWLQYQYAM